MRLFGFALFALLFFSCEKKASLPGYSVSDSGLEYKLIRLGDESQKPIEKDYLVVNYSVNRLKGGELLQQGSKLDTPLVFGQGSPLLIEALTKLVEGDSASFIFRAKNLMPHLNLSIADTEKVVFSLGLQKSVSKESFYLRQNYPGLMEAFPEESSDLAVFLADFDPLSVLAIGDMYFISTREGNGNRPMNGDVVNLDFEGYFVSGDKFDSTKDRNEPFEYTIGEMGQVLLGFNMGVRQLQEDGEALFVLPAHMAFDKRGSTDGTVPPNTTVVYYVKLNKIVHNES